MITVKAKGSYKDTFSFFERAKEVFNIGALNEYGRMGVESLREHTPADSGKTADSWDYQISRTKNSATITFTNSNISNGANVAIILQHGHATRSGNWVEGVNYIDPALKPVLEKIANDALKEATKK